MKRSDFALAGKLNRVPENDKNIRKMLRSMSAVWGTDFTLFRSLSLFGMVAAHCRRSLPPHAPPLAAPLSPPHAPPLAAPLATLPAAPLAASLTALPAAPPAAPLAAPLPRTAACTAARTATLHRVALLD